MWRRAAYNTTFCLLGCSLGELLTLYAYGFFDLSSVPAVLYALLCVLPVVNGLLTSIAFETAILVQKMACRDAARVAFGMSFISMTIMEASMEIVDIGATRGRLQINYPYLPLMLLAGYVAPLPYNYYQLKRHNRACH